MRFFLACRLLRIIDSQTFTHYPWEAMVEKEHFEVILEEIKHNNQALLEGFSLMSNRFGGVETRLERVEERLEGVELGQIALMTDMKEVKSDISQIKTDQAEMKADINQIKIDQAEMKNDQAEVKADQAEIKLDLRDIKRSSGLLHPIANDHENRIQGLEN
jgi:chromosome segregation ATPase